MSVVRDISLLSGFFSPFLQSNRKFPDLVKLPTISQHNVLRFEELHSWKNNNLHRRRCGCIAQEICQWKCQVPNKCVQRTWASAMRIRRVSVSSVQMDVVGGVIVQCEVFNLSKFQMVPLKSAQIMRLKLGS